MLSSLQRKSEGLQICPCVIFRGVCIWIALTSPERDCWLPVEAEGWRGGTPGSTRHRTGLFYWCVPCTAQWAACQTDWACSSERTGSRAPSASEETELPFRMLSNVTKIQQWCQTAHHLSVHGDDVPDKGAVWHRHGVSVWDTIGEGLLRGARNNRAGHAIGNQAWFSNVIVSCCPIGHRWRFYWNYW